MQRSQETIETNRALERGSILVVDDEEGVRLMVQAVLEDLGCEVKLAANGEQAVEIFARHRGEISAVLLDLTMPRLNGRETLQALRRILPEVKVILMSGYSQRKVAESLPIEQLAGFLAKPFQVTDLSRTVRKVLS